LARLIERLSIADTLRCKRFENKVETGFSICHQYEPFEMSSV